MTKPVITFTHNGKPLAPSYGKLSSLAFFWTADEGQERISTVHLRALLTRAGIDFPTNSSLPWHVELPNGEVIGAHAGRKVPTGKPVKIASWTFRPRPKARRGSLAGKGLRKATVHA
jgi:hypothetical protein